MVSIERHKLSEELPVTLGNMSGAINSYQVAVMGESLKDNTRLVPLGRCEASLVLDVDMITRDQVRELLAAPGQVLGAVCR